MGKIKWGVLGTAGIAKGQTIPGMKQADNCELYAVAGRSMEKAKEFQNEFGFEKAYGSYEELLQDDFSAMPFMNVKGYHCKSIAYSLWHVFRIEDIVAHSLIADDEQIFVRGDYQKRINAPIITTGNELIKEEIQEFSKQLQMDELYNYIIDVDSSTTEILKALTYQDSKEKISLEKRNKLEAMGVVSTDENAYWLIDYWCGKDVRGLLQMPFSRHWIMHIEACLRIRDKLLTKK